MSSWNSTSRQRINGPRHGNLRRDGLIPMVIPQNPDELSALVMALQCENENLKQELCKKEIDINQSNKIRMSQLRYLNDSENEISRLRSRIDELEQKLTQMAQQSFTKNGENQIMDRQRLQIPILTNNNTPSPIRGSSFFQHSDSNSNRRVNGKRSSFFTPNISNGPNSCSIGRSCTLGPFGVPIPMYNPDDREILISSGPCSHHHWVADSPKGPHAYWEPKDCPNARHLLYGQYGDYLNALYED